MKHDILIELNNISKEINEEYGYVILPGDNYGEPAINSGPCGPFAKAFCEIWNSQFEQKVNIVFVMTPDKNECWHIAVRLPGGELFDGGVGVHKEEKYEDKYFLEGMVKYDDKLMEERSYGLNRKYSRYCPSFSLSEVENIIRKHLNKISQQM